MPEHPGASTDRVGEFPDVGYDSAVDRSDLEVDNAGHLHVALRGPNNTVIETTLAIRR